MTAYGYDTTTFDLLSVTKDAGAGRLNLKTSFTYDTVGNVKTTTDPRGHVSGMTYDGMRRLLETTAPAPFAATVTKFAYDPDGRRVSVARATGLPATPWQTSSTTYDAAGKEVIATAADGATITKTYDTVGRVATSTSSSGRQAVFTYDLASRVTKVTDQVSGTLDPSITVNLGAVVREERTYFANGKLSTLTDGNGNKLEYGYDGFLRLAKITYPDHTVSTPDFELYALRRQ